MLKHLQIILNLGILSEQRNTPELLLKFEKYLNALTLQIECFDGHKTQIYRKKCETLLFKMCLTGYTLKHLYLGTTITSERFKNPPVLFDLATAVTTVRVLFENYLTIFHLFMQPNSDEELVLCRNLIYEISGLSQRQHLVAKDQATAIKKQKEKELIEAYKDILKSNNHFNSLTQEQQKSVLNPKQTWMTPSKLLTWNKLFKESNLNQDEFNGFWNLFSNYAHSEFLSVMQMDDYLKELNSLNYFKFVLLKLSAMICCNQIILNNSYLPQMLEKYNGMNEELRIEIEFWDKVSKGINDDSSPPKK